MDSKMNDALEIAGERLGLRNPTVLPPDPHTTGWALRWLNDDGEDEQVRVYRESFNARHEDVTPETVTAEVGRLIEAGETELVPK